jgi:hypothetical protein
MWPFKKRRPVGLQIDKTYGDPRARAMLDALSAREWKTWSPATPTT